MDPLDPEVSQLRVANASLMAQLQALIDADPFLGDRGTRYRQNLKRQQEQLAAAMDQIRILNTRLREIATDRDAYRRRIVSLRAQLSSKRRAKSS